MQYDAEALARALRGEQEAALNLQAQQAEYQRAQDMATRQNTGRTFFSALGNNAVRSRGREQVRELEPRLKKAREQAAQTYGAGKLYEAGLNADERQYSRSRDTQADEIAAAERARRQEVEDRNFEWTQGAPQRALAQSLAQSRMNDSDTSGGGELYVDPATGEQIAVFMTNNGPVDAAGTPVSTRFIPAQTSSSGPGRQGTARMDNDAVTLMSQRDAINRAAGIARTFTDEEFETLQSFQRRFGRELTSSMTPQAFNELIKNERDSMTPKIREFMIEVAALSAEERNRLFGSALTDTENRSSSEFLPNARAISPDDIRYRLGVMDSRAAAALENIDLVSGKDYLSSKEWNELPTWAQERELALKEQEIKERAASLQPVNPRGWQLEYDRESDTFAYVNPNDRTQWEAVE